MAAQCRVGLPISLSATAPPANQQNRSSIPLARVWGPPKPQLTPSVLLYNAGLSAFGTGILSARSTSLVQPADVPSADRPPPNSTLADAACRESPTLRNPAHLPPCRDGHGPLPRIGTLAIVPGVRDGRLQRRPPWAGHAALARRTPARSLPAPAGHDAEAVEPAQHGRGLRAALIESRP